MGTNRLREGGAGVEAEITIEEVEEEEDRQQEIAIQLQNHIFSAVCVIRRDI